jgi:tetratricopeptide (TPR) repeat protein
MNEWAADPDTLDARLAEARDEIADWARATVASRRPNARLMAEFLACLTDEDRRKAVVEATWPRLWKRLARPGEPPEPEPLLDALAAVTLIRRPDAAIVMHPVVAWATRAAAARDIRDSADEVLAGFWQAPPGSVSSDPGESARFVLPYLLRQEACGSAADVLAALTPAQLSDIGPSAIPLLRKVVTETGSPAAQVALALAVRQSDDRKLPEVRELLEEALSSALAAGDLRLSWVASGFLVNRHVNDGRLQAALELAGKREAYARLAGLGPWTRLASAAKRLAVQQRMGQHATVLAEIDGLRTRLDQLPDDDPDDSDSASAPELVKAWSVREDLLETGHEAADGLGQWQRALDMSTEALASMRRRGESGYGLAAWQRRSAESLIRLAEAAALLADCQQAAEDRGYRADVAYVLSSRAGLEEARGRPDTAADLERASLRLMYAEDLGPDPIAACHRRLGYFLSIADGDKDEAAAHSIAALLIFRLIQIGTDPASLVRAAALARQDADRTRPVPWTVTEVVQVTERVDGIRLGELLATLEPDQQALAEALNRLLSPRPDAATLIDWAARGLARWLREK